MASSRKFAKRVAERLRALPPDVAQGIIDAMRAELGVAAVPCATAFSDFLMNYGHRFAKELEFLSHAQAHAPRLLVFDWVETTEAPHWRGQFVTTGFVPDLKVSFEALQTYVAHTLETTGGPRSIAIWMMAGLPEASLDGPGHIGYLRNTQGDEVFIQFNGAQPQFVPTQDVPEFRHRLALSLNVATGVLIETLQQAVDGCAAAAPELSLTADHPVLREAGRQCAEAYAVEQTALNHLSIYAVETALAGIEELEGTLTKSYDEKLARQQKRGVADREKARLLADGMRRRMEHLEREVKALRKERQATDRSTRSAGPQVEVFDGVADALDSLF